MSEHPVHPWYGPCDAFVDGECSVCRDEVSQAKDTIARLTRERDEARAESEEAAAAYNAVASQLRTVAAERDAARAAYASASREWAERHEHARERIHGLTGERDAARRELHRLTHGEAIEGDGVCRHEIDAQAARAERDEANARCARQADEIERLRDVVRGYMASHGERQVRLLHALIGQSVRERDAARRWSRLWHREARRLWRILKRIGWEPGRLWACLPVTACKACQERDDRVNEYMRALAEHEAYITTLEAQLVEARHQQFEVPNKDVKNE